VCYAAARIQPLKGAPPRGQPKEQLLSVCPCATLLPTSSPSKARRPVANSKSSMPSEYMSAAGVRRRCAAPERSTCPSRAAKVRNASYSRLRASGSLQGLGVREPYAIVDTHRNALAVHQGRSPRALHTVAVCPSVCLSFGAPRPRMHNYALLESPALQGLPGAKFSPSVCLVHGCARSPSLR
jgi:hypothetical protein